LAATRVFQGDGDAAVGEGRTGEQAGGQGGGSRQGLELHQKALQRIQGVGMIDDRRKAVLGAPTRGMSAPVSPPTLRIRTKHCLDISVQKLRKRNLFRMSIF
jgi:hypothetical protein